MPVIPTVNPKNWAGAQLPRVMSIDASPLERGGQAIAQGLMQVGEVALRIRERKIEEETQALVSDWQQREINTWDGAPGDEEGADPVRGVKDWGEGDGSAVDAIKQTWTDWRDNPEGRYAKASSAARRRADRMLENDTARIFSLAAQKDVAISDARRNTQAKIALTTAERQAQLYAHDHELFQAAASDAADAEARIKLGRLIRNPEESDPEALVFSTPEGAQLYSAVRAQAFEKLSHGRAVTLASSAGTAKSESDAADRIRMAQEVASGLPDDLRADVERKLDGARAARLDGMLGYARAEVDLDRQERLVQVAEQAAKAYGANGNLTGAVSDQAQRIRADAQRAENQTAIATLAEGREYTPGDNPRKQSALAWAQPKIEKARQAEQRQTLAGNEEFIGAMVGSGAWFGNDGELRALSLDEGRSLLRAQLAEGNIRPTRYLTEKAKLDKIEASGMKTRYERAAAEVNAALGEEIKTLWAGSEATLAAGEDPSRKVAKYTFEETKRELVPETETVTAYRGGSLFGIPSAQTRRTGRMIEKVTTLRHKRELMAADVTKAINLLMHADDANGLMVDLDGNPATPAEKLDARTYKSKLVADIKARQLAIDLDTQSAGIFNAVSTRQRDARILDAAALSRSAKLRLPSAKENNLEEDDNADPLD